MAYEQRRAVRARRKRRAVTARLYDAAARLRGLIREAGYVRCAHCGRRLPAGAVEVDHIRPLSDGGQDVRANVQILCRSCHRTKTARGPPWPGRRVIAGSAFRTTGRPVGRRSCVANPETGAAEGYNVVCFADTLSDNEARSVSVPAETAHELSECRFVGADDLDDYAFPYQARRIREALSAIKRGQELPLLVYGEPVPVTAG